MPARDWDILVWVNNTDERTCDVIYNTVVTNMIVSSLFYSIKMGPGSVMRISIWSFEFVNRYLKTIDLQFWWHNAALLQIQQI